MSTPPTNVLTVRRAFLHVGLAAAGFCALAAGIRALVPWPEEYGLSAKFEHFAEHVEDYDAVYLGSSHVWRGIDPAVVDRELAAGDIEFNSFNLGVGGSRIWEWDYLVHQILALEPERLRWIFFESADWDPTFPSDQFAYSFRTVHWHTVPQTRKVLAATWKADLPASERIDLALTHVQLLLWNLANYGQGRRIVYDFLGEPMINAGFDLQPEEYALDEGYQPEKLMMHPAFRNEVDEYRARVARIDPESEREVDLAHVHLGGLRQQVAETRARGIELVYVTIPGDTAVPEVVTLHANGHIPTLYDFNRPGRYPFVFGPETRFSSHHLNALGAKRLSKLLARRIERHMRQQRD